jgi:hypothetical protein
MRFNPHTMGIGGAVVLAILLDVLLFIYRPPDSLVILIIADSAILVGLAIDAILRLRQRSVHSDLFRRLAESSPLADLSEESASSSMNSLELQGNATGFVRHDSPEGLEVPAFICACGHPHQFLCLTCQTTAEKARQTGGTKWVEWPPGMKEVDY